jgi:peptidoglycan hydrolase CwlO-like protein
MRKIFLLFLMTFLMMCFISVAVVHAEGGEEIPTTETVVEENESYLSSLEEETARIVEWIIAGIVGIVGTSGAAVLFRKQLVTLFEQVKTALASLKTNKELAEETLKGIKKEAQNTLKSLEKVKEEVCELHKDEFAALREQIALLEKTVCIFAGGTKEMICNGSAKAICDLVANNGFEVSENEGKEVQ